MWECQIGGEALIFFGALSGITRVFDVLEVEMTRYGCIYANDGVLSLGSRSIRPGGWMFEAGSECEFESDG